jgi:hypothetical protein
MRTAILAISSVMLLASPILSPALARGGHEHGLRHGLEHGLEHSAHMHGATGGFAGGHRHGDEAEVKAAAEENDRLLNNKIKSICRGC